MVRPGVWLAAVLLMTSGCTAISPRPKNTLRTLLDITPTASRIGAADFTATMDRVTDSRAAAANRVQLLINGEQAFPAMLAAIEKARRRVSCETYILRLDALGGRFVKAMTAAARRGVEVRFLLDAFGSRTINETDLGPLRQAGGQVRFFNPISHWTAIRVNNRDHRKILVVDGEVAFLGGLNLATEYDGNGLQGWRDTHLRIAGPAAQQAELVFAESWQQGGTGFLGRDLPIVGTHAVKRAVDDSLRLLLARPGPWRPPPALAAGADTHTGHGTSCVRIVSSAPERMASRILDMYLLAINSARRRIGITNGYFVPPSTLTRALCRAAERGVDVCLLLQGKTDEPTTRTISVGFYGEMLNHGVRIYEWPHSVLHAKSMVVDGQWLTVGSANLDGRALFLDYEANAAVLDAALARQAEAQFQRDLARSRRVDLETWQKRPWKQKAAEVILTPVEGQF